MKVDTESKYLKQSDVDGEMTVTIAKVGKVNLAKDGDAPEYKWAVRFQEFDKPMLLNATNIKRIVKAMGTNESDDWAGKKIVLYVDPDIEFAGNVVGGLRLRSAAQQKKRVSEFPPEAGDLSDIPF